MADLDPSFDDPAPCPPPRFDELGPRSPRAEEAAELAEGAPPTSLAPSPLAAIRHIWAKFAALLVMPDQRTLVAWAPVVIPLIILPLMIPLIRIELNNPLFGDTYVFQYTGWCIRHGLRLYRDIGMADGPFIHFLHAIMQNIVGLTARSFRKGDLVWEAAGGALIGLLFAPRVVLPRRAHIAQRAIWAATGMAVWLSWYLCMDWQTTTQRESYYALFGSVGMVLLYASAEWKSRRHVAIGTFLGAFLTCTQVFGKPTGLGYVALGGLSVLLANVEAIDTRRFRVRMFLYGAGACTAVTVLALLFWGSIPGYFFWCWKIPWYGNKFLFGINWYTLLLSAWDSVRLIALSSIFVGVAAIAGGVLPGRALGITLTPAVFWFGACLQARGYTYQTLPVYAAVYTLLLTVLAALWRESTNRRWTSRRGLVAAIALAFAGQTCIDNYQKSPYRWLGDSAQWDKSPVAEFAAAEQEVGLYLREHTNPDAKVFAYSAGENAHVLLFYARRRTASPFFHSFWLDPVGLLPQSQIKPNDRELAALEALQAEARQVACNAVETAPPEAMAFNLLPQVFKVCPNVEKLLNTTYDETTTMKGYHIYMRKPHPS